jgi:hypothetical protein
MLSEDDFRLGLLRHMMNIHYSKGISSWFWVCMKTGRCSVHYDGGDYHFRSLTSAVGALYATCPN